MFSMKKFLELKNTLQKTHPDTEFEFHIAEAMEDSQGTALFCVIEYIDGPGEHVVTNYATELGVEDRIVIKRVPSLEVLETQCCKMFEQLTSTTFEKALKELAEDGSAMRSRENTFYRRYKKTPMQFLLDNCFKFYSFWNGGMSQ